jgi:hypothetical protein
MTSLDLSSSAKSEKLSLACVGNALARARPASARERIAELDECLAALFGRQRSLAKHRAPESGTTFQAIALEVANVEAELILVRGKEGLFAAVGEEAHRVCARLRQWRIFRLFLPSSPH